MISPNASWSIEELVVQRTKRLDWSTRHRISLSAGKHGTARAYKELPILLVVVSSATSVWHDAILNAVELLQQATGGFRVVVFTDANDLALMRSFGWPIEHFSDEASWAKVSSRDWLSSVADRLEWILNTYGPAAVFAAANRSDFADGFAGVAQTFDIPRSIVDSTLGRLEDQLPKVDETVHKNWRGWLSAVQMGTSRHTVEHPAGLIDVRVERSPSDSMLFVCVRDDDHEAQLLRGTRALGWNRCVVRLPVRSQRSTEIVAAIEAFRHAFLRGGFVAAALDEEDALAMLSGHGASEVQIWFSHADDNWELLTSYGKRLSDSSVVSAETLERLNHIARTTRLLYS